MQHNQFCLNGHFNEGNSWNYDTIVVNSVIVNITLGACKTVLLTGKYFYTKHGYT